MHRLIALLAFATLPMSADAETLDTLAGPMQAVPVVTGLDVPWAFGFLPEGGQLITERDGRLLRAGVDGQTARILGLPDIADTGQGGLLDLLIPRDFAQTRILFMTYSKPQGRGAGTAVLRARLDEGQTTLRNVQTIFESAPGSRGGRHFGSRLVEGRDGTLFLTVGDRGDDDTAQDRRLHNGSVLRITKDGKAPPDNPFVGSEGVQPEIWSFGHRNPQGAALDRAGTLWINEHGARGGDEVNRIEKGANYGWPVIAYGRHYSGLRIGEGTEKPGLQQPVHYWDPSIAPSGMVFHSGQGQPDWRGDAFVGSLKFDYIARLDGTPLREVEQIKGDSTLRVRDVREGPEGDLWFLSEGNGTLYRLSKASGG